MDYCINNKDNPIITTPTTTTNTTNTTSASATANLSQVHIEN
jgi:hypothetical protein